MKADALTDQIVLIPNLLSLYASNGGIKAAADQMADMAESGFLGLFDALPCVPYRAISQGEVPKKGTDELRGVGDQGQPRKPLYTQHSWETVLALNEASKHAEWSHQDMDSLESACANGAIVQHLGDLNNETCIEMAFDFSKYFHRFYMRTLNMWQMGCIVPSKDDPEALKYALEYVMTMGASPSSQVAQRFANAMLQQICMRMHYEEKARWANPRLDDLTDKAREALWARRGLPKICYGSQAAMFNLLMYCDDARFVVAGAARAVRLLRHFWDIIGPNGLVLPLSRASKQQTGVSVVWLGGCLATGIGLVWIPLDKKVRAAEGLEITLRG